MLKRFNIAGYAFTLPAVALLVIFLLYPFLDVIGFSTTKWNGFGDPEPIGLRNYNDILVGADKDDFRHSLWVTLKFALLTLVPFVTLSVGMALAVHKQPYERFVKALLFLPGLVTLSGAAVSWYTLFHPEYGALATVMSVPKWNDSEVWALVFVMLFTLWRHLGYGVLVVSSRLKSIPTALLEAAAVDGATANQAFRYVILPLLKPAVAFLLAIGTVLSLQSYTAVFLLTRGDNGTDVMGYYLYKTVFESGRFGYGSALTVLLLLVTLLFAFSQAALLKEDK